MPPLPELPVTSLGEGTFGGARRRADGLVERRAGAWTHTVHDLLRHLAATDVDHVPEPVRIEAEVELQRRLGGAPGWHPPHPSVRRAEALGELAAWLGSMHTASAGFRRPDGEPAVWATGPGEVAEDQVVVHGDLGLWNTLWDGGGLTGVVDWDLAEPAPTWWDVANLTWAAVPVTPVGRPGLPTDGWVPDQPRRLAALAEALGRTGGELLSAVADWLDLQVARRTTDVPDGELWAQLAARSQQVAELRSQRAWLDVADLAVR